MSTLASTGFSRLPALPDILTELETGVLAPHAFDHRGHVFAAWAAMQQYGATEGARRFRRALRAYCDHLDAGDKYHVTITEALLQLVAHHLPEPYHADRRWQAQWHRFEKRAEFLLNTSRSILAVHYSDSLLAQPRARTEFIAPDLAPLP